MDKNDFDKLSLIKEDSIRKVKIKGKWYFAAEDIIHALSKPDTFNGYVRVITNEDEDDEDEVNEIGFRQEELSDLNEKLKKGLGFDPKQDIDD